MWFLGCLFFIYVNGLSDFKRNIKELIYYKFYWDYLCVHSGIY